MRAMMLLFSLAGCGNLSQSIDEGNAALGGACNGQSDPSCVGLPQGSVCEGTGKCRLDPDYAGACDCIVPVTQPPPPPPCTCSGIAPGQSCGWGRTCHIVTTGMILYCACS